MYYIFNKDGVCVCSCDYEFDSADLASRNETAIESNEIYELNKIKIENGVIVAIEPPTPTAEEIQKQLTELYNLILKYTWKMKFLLCIFQYYLKIYKYLFVSLV